MRKLTGWHRSCVVGCTALAGVLAGCSSGSSSSSAPSGGGGSSSPTSAAPTSAAPTSAAPSGGGGSSATKAKITADFEAFFSPKTPVKQKIMLLQNGQLFAKIIAAQANSSLASSASAKVKSVTVTSATMATVAYDVLLGGTAALSNQQGQAIYQGGIWKVGDSSFCGLLHLEQLPNLPPVCKG